MSAATPFIARRPLPFCIEDFDLDAVDLTTVEPSWIFVRGLTLNEALHIYWNLESVDLEYAISGLVLLNGVGDPVDVVASFDQTLVPGTLIEPRLRVCMFTEKFDLSATETAGEHWTEYAIVHDEDITVHFRLDGNNPDDFPEGCIFKEPDDTYTIVLQFSGGTFAGIGGGGLLHVDVPGGIGGARIGSPINVPVLGGSVDIWLYAKDPSGSGAYQYDSGGSLDSIALDLSYFTYP